MRAFILSVLLLGVVPAGVVWADPPPLTNSADWSCQIKWAFFDRPDITQVKISHWRWRQGKAFKFFTVNQGLQSFGVENAGQINCSRFVGGVEPGLHFWEVQGLGNLNGAVVLKQSGRYRIPKADIIACATVSTDLLFQLDVPIHDLEAGDSLPHDRKAWCGLK